MPGIFEIIPGKKDSIDSTPLDFSLGLKIKIGQFDTICSITEFLSSGELEQEIESLKNDLDDILKKLVSFKKGNVNQGFSDFDDSASPQEIWESLSNITDNSQLIEQFNSLNESRRRELADYVFANCNMFSGKGAFFSARYVQETALLAG